MPQGTNIKAWDVFDLFIADVEVLIWHTRFTCASVTVVEVEHTDIKVMCSVATGDKDFNNSCHYEMTETISYLAALILSGHIVQHCSIVNEGI